MSNAKLKQKRRQKAIQEFGGQCNYCQSTDRLQFDHVDPKTKLHRVRDLWDSAAKWAIEHPKLQLLCYTCHRAKTVAEQTKPLIHGTTNAYNRKGCRCDVCKTFMSIRAKEFRARLKQGKGRPLPNG